MTLLCLFLVLASQAEAIYASPSWDGVNLENRSRYHSKAKNVNFFDETDNASFSQQNIETKEDALIKSSPENNLGILNVIKGVRRYADNSNFVSVYHRKELFVPAVPPNISGRGHGFLPAKDPQGNIFHRLVLTDDYPSGKTPFGAGRAGVSYYFTRHISILTGPGWFRDAETNRQWQWTLQVNLEIPFSQKK